MKISFKNKCCDLCFGNCQGQDANGEFSKENMIDEWIMMTG